MIDILMHPISQIDCAKSFAYDIELSLKESLPELYVMLDSFEHYMTTGCLHSAYAILGRYGAHLDMLQDLAFCHFHSIVHKVWGIEELIKFTEKYWELAKTNATSVAIKQFTAHRLVDDKRFELTIRFYKDSIIRAKELNMMKWVVSGYFYWARYSDLNSKEPILLDMFTYSDYRNIVPYDVFTDKVLRCYLWLKCFGSMVKSKEIVAKYDVMLKDYEALSYLTTLTAADIDGWRHNFLAEPDKFTGMVYHP